MKIIYYLILLPALMFAASGCIASVVEVTPIPPTTVVLPTFTSASPDVAATEPPAATEAPSATIEPSPTTGATATPTIPPTPDPNKNVGDTIFTDNFTGEIGWLWTFEDEAARFGAQDGQLDILSLKKAGGWRYSLYFDAVHGDQQIAVSVRNNRCADADEVGMAYRATEEPANNYNMYIFSINCAGQARVLRLNGTDLVALSNWQDYPALNQGANADNRLMVWMFKDEFNFYANDQYLFTLNDPSLAEGFYGFFLNGGASGDASFTLTSFEVKEVKSP
ncbi:MAG: hypothetical protein HYZ49_19340 [Chloroflexi bacterium]|nr:hypothetical protein [Chloroflexota bacterium]